jgi:hypothetical protein
LDSLAIGTCGSASERGNVTYKRQASGKQGGEGTAKEGKMPTDPLRRLRTIREKLKRLDAERADLVEGRDVEIHRALEAGCSERKVAEAAGLHHSRIGKIKRRGPPTE